ncbi:MAG: B12-binding domain-containing radical SAM protein [Deltaproteobacteria bacterium]|nr:B12-binding domain-containing radical SAM protein [Deltaproteobacteria bacterium]
MTHRSGKRAMYYAEPVYRPPSEAYSLLVQATVGCSSAAAGRCYFCSSYLFHREVPEKRFRIRPTAEILEDIEIGGDHYGERIEKIFLLDSNAMIIKTPELLKILNKCTECFPNLKQVACYACCDDILRKSDEELEELREAGLKLVFIGLESGDPEVLELMNKGATVQDQIDSVVRANRAGIQTSVTVIIGLGGRKLSRQHAVNTGKAATAMNPTFFSALTLMVVPDTPLDDMVNRGEFELVTDPREALKELELMIRNIDAPGPVVFRTNHASNYLPLAGTLPRDREMLLGTIEDALRDPRRLRPESMRGL